MGRITNKQKYPNLIGMENDYVIGEYFNWNINTKIDNMSYLDRMKEGQRNEIERFTKAIETSKDRLAQLEDVKHPSNKELYAMMYNWEVVSIGRCFSITVPEGFLLSPEQEEIVQRFVRDTYEVRGQYGDRENLSVEVTMFRIFDK